jgi:integrase
MKRASGRRAVQMAYIFRYLDRFLVSCHASDLTRETFLDWSESMSSLHANTRAGRLRVVYRFCLFRRREQPGSFVPDPTQFPPWRPRPLPYIFSEADIIRLHDAAGDLAPHKTSPLHCAVARIAIVILYTTGLRRGELVRLTLGDYDTTDCVFHVRRTKFDKSRLVPLSADTVMELDRHLKARLQAGAPSHEDAPLLVHNHGGPFRDYTGGGIGELLRKVIRTTGIRTSRGRPPRIHDLRFTFAVQALSRWYRTGVDVQARLPALATYLGHVSVLSTQYYLTFFAATAEAASERFHAHAAGWLSPGALEGNRS